MMATLLSPAFSAVSFDGTSTSRCRRFVITYYFLRSLLLRLRLLAAARLRCCRFDYFRLMLLTRRAMPLYYMQLRRYARAQSSAYSDAAR